VVEYPRLAGRFLEAGLRLPRCGGPNRKKPVFLVYGDIGIHAKSGALRHRPESRKKFVPMFPILFPAINWMMMPIFWFAIRAESRECLSFPDFYRRRKRLEYPGYALKTAYWNQRPQLPHFESQRRYTTTYSKATKSFVRCQMRRLPAGHPEGLSKACEYLS